MLHYRDETLIPGDTACLSFLTNCLQKNHPQKPPHHFCDLKRWQDLRHEARKCISHLPNEDVPAA